MKILDRRKIAPIHLMVGDSLVVQHNEAKRWWDWSAQTVLAKTKITAAQAMIVDEAALFETVFEGRRALGGMVIERE